MSFSLSAIIPQTLRRHLLPFLVSSLFDSWFGYILWACCYWHLNRGKPFSNKRHLVEYMLNIVMFITGFFLFGAGTYASVQSQ